MPHSHHFKGTIKRWEKEDYIRWKLSRGDTGEWSHDDCCKADRLIREISIDAFNRWAQFNIKNVAARNFMKDMVRCHFGSVNVDTLLNSLRCYPDWM